MSRIRYVNVRPTSIAARDFHKPVTQQEGCHGWQQEIMWDGIITNNPASEGCNKTEHVAPNLIHIFWESNFNNICAECKCISIKDTCVNFSKQRHNLLDNPIVISVLNQERTP